MLLKDKLEIILITYNRKSFLEKTFNQIFSDDSPIKNLNITVLDNKSTDGTSQFIDEYTKNFPNVKHIIHNRNIGGNGNIARAFEIASAEYLWILCDDDDFDWSNWQQIETAINNDYDVIFTEISNFKHFTNIASIMRGATFVPATIYKTELITDDVMQNAMVNNVNLFPHLAVMCYAVNENKKIFIPDKGIINIGNRTKGAMESGFYTSKKENTHPYARDMFLVVGFVNSIQMIKDKKKRAYILNHMSAKKTGFFREISANFKRNRFFYNNSFKNICDVFCGINCWQKIQFVFALTWLDILYFVKKFLLRKNK